MKRVVPSILTVVILFTLATFASCTQNQMAKQYGGTMTINLPAGQKLVNATWKEADPWYLYRPMRPGEVAEESTFQEDSNFGVMQGKVVFREHAQK